MRGIRSGPAALAWGMAAACSPGGDFRAEAWPRPETQGPAVRLILTAERDEACPLDVVDLCLEVRNVGTQPVVLPAPDHVDATWDLWVSRPEEPMVEVDGLGIPECVIGPVPRCRHGFRLDPGQSFFHEYRLDPEITVQFHGLARFWFRVSWSERRSASSRFVQLGGSDEKREIVPGEATLLSNVERIVFRTPTDPRARAVLAHVREPEVGSWRGKIQPRLAVQDRILALRGGHGEDAGMRRADLRGTRYQHLAGPTLRGTPDFALQERVPADDPGLRALIERVHEQAHEHDRDNALWHYAGILAGRGHEEAARVLFRSIVRRLPHAALAPAARARLAGRMVRIDGDCW